MTSVRICVAETPADVAAVRQLCRDFVAWVIAANPEQEDKIRIYFEPVKWEKTLADLPILHARPKGALLLARLDGRPVGCIMYHELSPGVAEIKRLFVAPDARGAGVAKGLVDALIRMTRTEGYRELHLDTARFLGAAIDLYRKLGFEVVSEGVALPAEIMDQIIYMKRRI